MRLSSNSNDMEGMGTASDEVNLKSSTRVLKIYRLLITKTSHRNNVAPVSLAFALLQGASMSPETTRA